MAAVTTHSDFGALDINTLLLYKLTELIKYGKIEIRKKMGSATCKMNN